MILRDETPLHRIINRVLNIEKIATRSRKISVFSMSKTDNSVKINNETWHQVLNKNYISTYSIEGKKN